MAPPGVIAEDEEGLEVNLSSDAIKKKYIKESRPAIGQNSKFSATEGSSTLPALTPRSGFALRQANHLVEKICEEQGIESRQYTFAKCLIGREGRVFAWSEEKHMGVLRIGDYLQKRSQIEREYGQSLQKLNRQLIQAGDLDERFSQLIVMGEKTATGHLDWSRKVMGSNLVEELKSLSSENEAQRRHLSTEISQLQENWSRVVKSFEKVRGKKEKAQQQADSAQIAVESARTRGSLGPRALKRLQQEAERKAAILQETENEYAAALNQLNAKQQEISRQALPNCYNSLEKLERARIGAVRMALLAMAQAHLALATVELEGGERWINSLVAVSVDEEIEEAVRILCNGYVETAPDEENDGDGEFSEDSDEEIKKILESTKVKPQSSKLLSLQDLRSAADGQVQGNIQKLRQQLAALKKLEMAYVKEGPRGGNSDALKAIQQNMKEIERELKKLEISPARAQDEDLKGEDAGMMHSTPQNALQNTPSRASEPLAKAQIQDSTKRPIKNRNPSVASQKKSKKSLSRSFDEILQFQADTDGSSDLEKNQQLPSEAIDLMTTKTLKLPGAQWTDEKIQRSLEAIGEEGELEKNAKPQKRTIYEERRQNTNTFKSLPPLEKRPPHTVLFQVRAVHPFKGTSNEELDLRPNEILSVFDTDGEWWVAENETGARGFIPFNYVIKI